MNTSIIALIILLITVILFIINKLPAPLVGVGSLFLMVLFNVCSFKEAFSGFSDSIVILMASSMIIGIAMFKTGTAQLIGRQVIKFSHGNEKTFMIVSCLVSGLLAMFLANTAVLASFIPIIDSVCRSKDHMKAKNLLLPVACSVMLGGASTLIGCTPQLTANALMEKMIGLKMEMWTLTPVGLILFFTFLIYMYFFGYNRANKIWGDRADVDLGVSEEKRKSIENANYDKKKVYTMLILCIIMIFLYVTSVLPTVMTALLIAILCVGFNLISINDIMKELRWDTIVFLAACLGIANALTISKAGELIGHAVSLLIGNVTSAILILIVLTLLTLILSQFITNSTAIIVVLPIAIELCKSFNFNVMPFTLAITYAASIAFLTPLAAAQITMTQVADYKFTDYYKFGIVFTIISFIEIVIFVPMFYNI